MRYPYKVTLTDGTQWVCQSSFDDEVFWVPASEWLRDYQTRPEEAVDFEAFDGSITSCTDRHGEELTPEELQYALGS